MKNKPITFAVPGFMYGLDELCHVLVDGSAEPLLAIDTQYKILLANPAAGRWLGHPRHELLQTSLLRYLPSPDSAALLNFLDAPLSGHRSGFARLFELSGRQLLWTAYTLRDKDGALHGALCRVQDRTEAERTRRQLLDLQRQLHEKEVLLQSRAELAGTLIEASPGLTFVLDRELRFCAANKAYLEYSGRTLPELMGKTLDEAFPLTAEGPLPAALARVLEGKAETLTNVPCTVRSGSCSIQLTPLTYEGFVYGVLVMAEMEN